MLSTNNYQSPDKVLASLNFFIENHIERQGYWFSANTEMNADDSEIVEYTKKLHPYVFSNRFDLTGHIFEYHPGREYPYCNTEQCLWLYAATLFDFWQSFIGDAVFSNIYMDDRAKPFTTLVIDAYLRSRVDFCDFNTSLESKIVFIDDLSTEVIPETDGLTTFTFGEVAHLSELSIKYIYKLIEGRQCATPSANNPENSSSLSRPKTQQIEFSPLNMPENLKNFYDGKLDNKTSSRLVIHKDLSILLAKESNYEPCQFFTIGSDEIEIPDYSSSQAIHQAINSWIRKKNHSKRKMMELMQHIGAESIAEGENKRKFEQRMAEGDIRLSLPIIASINNFMRKDDGEKENDESSPFLPLLKYMP